MVGGFQGGHGKAFSQLGAVCALCRNTSKVQKDAVAIPTSEEVGTGRRELVFFLSDSYYRVWEGFGLTELLCGHISAHPRQQEEPEEEERGRPHCGAEEWELAEDQARA